MSSSAASTERTRIITQDATWREQLATKQAKATAAIQTHKEMKQQKLNDEKERHTATMEALAKDYDLFVANDEAVLQKCKEDAEK